MITSSSLQDIETDSIGRGRAYFAATMSEFLNSDVHKILGTLSMFHTQDLVHQQTSAWRFQIEFLQRVLGQMREGSIYFEFSIPRFGRRADVVIYIRGIVFVLEFKVGSEIANRADIDQVESYALDLKNFHAGSHSLVIVPILIATSLDRDMGNFRLGRDRVAYPICLKGDNLADLITSIANQYDDPSADDAQLWYRSSYLPTPTIIQAAQALYANHSVAEITRSDAGARNLTLTSSALTQVVHHSRVNSRKSICFVTGVPGSGKTLAGLNLATSLPEGENAVFLSGNGPLVDVLREALARDESKRLPGVTKSNALRKARGFVQNIHHFRDDALVDNDAPTEHVVVFDEAQRAWDRDAASKFMKTKRGQLDFDKSEPQFLIEIMDRHEDWCTVVALIGGGQEINSGEAGLQGWRDALAGRFPDWDIYYSDMLGQTEYAGGKVDFDQLPNSVVSPMSSLHLSVSMRSFRAQSLSSFVHHLVAGNSSDARQAYAQIKDRYPVLVTRELPTAKKWVQSQTRGTERSGILASTNGGRLKPFGINIDHKVDAPIWFLNQATDVRASSFLEDAASEFEVQGLELDWTLIGWDADFRMGLAGFEHWSFSGTTWKRIGQPDRRRYLENAYRVLLTRARQGMVLFVPQGSTEDQTRTPELYDHTYSYLLSCGVQPL